MNLSSIKSTKHYLLLFDVNTHCFMQILLTPSPATVKLVRNLGTFIGFFMHHVSCNCRDGGFDKLISRRSKRTPLNIPDTKIIAPITAITLVDIRSH